MPKNTLFALLVLAVTACASGGTASGSTAGTSTAGTSTAGTSAAVRRDRNVISTDELADPTLTALSVYEVIQSLRPNFLSNRGQQVVPYDGHGGMVDTESGKVHASIDGASIVSIEELKRLHVNGVLEIRLLSPSAAMQKFGATAREGPVIVVKTM